MKTPDDIKESIQNYLKGDKDVFETIYKLSYAYLHTCVIHVMKDEDAAQDILQETYIEIAKNMEQLRDPESFMAWAAMIANRKCFAALKQKNREILTPDGEDPENFFENIADDEEYIPEYFAQKKEKQRLLREIVDDLTDMQRLCVIAFFYNQIPQEEIARELGIPVNTVKSHLNRAKAKIKAAVVELDEEKGTRLYSFAPLLLLLLGMDAEACEIPDMPERVAREAGVKAAGAESAGEAGVKTADAESAGEAEAENADTESAGEAEAKAAGSKSAGGGTGNGSSARLPKAVVLPVAAAAAVVGAACIFLFTRPKDAGTSGGEAAVTEESAAAEEQFSAVEEQPAEENDLQDENVPETDDAAAQEASEDADQEQEASGKPEQAQGTGQLQELTALSEMTYDSYGNAHGGVMPVMQDGLWGIADYEGNLVVPCEYDGFYAAPDELGNTVFYRNSVSEETEEFDDFGGGREYVLLDKEGNILYQGADEVRASGGMYITMHRGDESDTVEYHRLDGSLAFSLEEEWNVSNINTYYDGISYVYDSINASAYAEMSTLEDKGPKDGDIPSRIGSVDSQGEVSWKDDPAYYDWWEMINARIDEAAEFADNDMVNGSGVSIYSGRAPISTINHGYYVTGSFFMEPGYLNVYDEAGEHTAELDYFHFSLDGNDGITYDENVYDETSDYRGYYVDGGYLWNYGPHMVFMIQGRNVLVDFSKNTEKEGVNPEQIVTAVYDYISMADEKYWLVQSGDQYGYIDHDGNEAGMFDDASAFSGGYALIIEDGEVWLIDEELNRLQDLGPGYSVAAVGELFRIASGDKTAFYQKF